MSARGDRRRDAVTPGEQSATLGGMSPEPVALADVVERIARRHGIDLRHLPEHTPQAGAAETEQERAERLALQAANRAARWRDRLPAIYRDASLASLADDQHPDALRQWWPSGSATLVCAGQVGTGKTYAAYAVANAAVARGALTEAWRVSDLLDALRPGDIARSTRASVVAVDLLVLDDLAGIATPFAQEAVTSIMDERINHGRRTIVTTNLGAQEVAEGWGPRLMDRLTYRATALRFTGASRRRGAW